MFDYKDEKRDFSALIGQDVRDEDMIIIGKVESISTFVDGYGHQNVMIHVDNGRTVNARNLLNGANLVKTRELIVRQVDPWEPETEKKEYIKFGPPVEENISHFTYTKPTALIKKKANKAREKQADFMSTVDEVITLQIGDK